MAGNNIYVQGSYVDIHDNEVVNLSVDKGEVHVGDNGKTATAIWPAPTGTWMPTASPPCRGLRLR